MTLAAGYYRFPTIHQDQVVFVSEDDLWTVPVSGGTARRLTSGLGAASAPSLSPDGKWIAFASRDEGPAEVFVMPAQGGAPRRLTFLGAMTRVLGWRNDWEILFTSNAGQAFARDFHAYAISLDGGQPQPLHLGPVYSIGFGPHGTCAIGRNASDPARWKRYRGGTAGEILVDADGKGQFHPLIQPGGNLAYPMWIGERVYFLSDHEGIGNLYSCRPNGKELRRHTHHDEFYVRHPASDGRRIVYHAGADLFCFDPKTDTSKPVPVSFHSPRTQLFRKFVEAGNYLEDFQLHPQGHLLGLLARGKPVTMGNWAGPAAQAGEPDGVRYRLFRWLNDGKRFVVLSDAGGEERLEIHSTDGLQAPKALGKLPFGRAVDMKVDPTSDQVALVNHRNDLIVVDLKKGKQTLIDTSKNCPVGGFNWSPDGKWLAYSRSISVHCSAIWMADVKTRKTVQVTAPVLKDVAPVFDPDGKYLYFLSHREFDPVYDRLHFDLGFPRGIRPYLITLAKDTPTPFLQVPKPPTEPDKKADAAAAAKNGKDAKAKKDGKAAPKPVVIDFEGIAQRVQAFPVPDGIYIDLAAISGKVLFASVPIQGALGINWTGDQPPKTILESFDLELQKTEPVVSPISDFRLSGDRKWLIYRTGNRVRVIKAGEKSDEAAAKEGPSRKSGWIDLGRVQVSILPQAEWRQMYREAWRLQRDHFWTEDMSQIDWEKVYRRYLPLIDRLGTRGEFSDLVWEMQGELGTSHAYEMGGDYRPEPVYGVGQLGANLAWDARQKRWKVDHLVVGDPWDARRSSPLLRPGLGVKPGDTILAVNGRPLGAGTPPGAFLVNHAGKEVQVTLGDAKGAKPRVVTIKTLVDETPARYRDWVEGNRRWVHEKTGGRIGYVHIPDMGARGFAEFHRSFLAEVDRDGLVVDVRYNGGGHVSQLLLEKLARRRIAYVQSRWFGVEPYPIDSVAGPIVALTNEHAGSDGDIFSHCFKLLKLGPLLGKRTWGGVVGIWPRNLFVDGGLTTQPEFSFWFQDVGWEVENYGTDPDIEVGFLPQDYAAGRDPQLERTVKEALALLKAKPPVYPDLRKARPKLPLPRLPKK